MAITQISSAEKCISLAYRVGLEEDQLRRFLLAGYLPQPKEMEFLALARQADRLDGPDRIAMGGTRGQSKSHCVFSQATIDDCQRVEGLKGLYLRKIQKRARESLDDLRRKVLARVPHHYAQGVLRFPNGSFIILGGFHTESEIDAYLGLEYDFAIIEDATTLTKTKREAVRGAIRSSRDDWRPRLYETANPGGVGHGWFTDEYIKPKDTRSAFVHTRLGDNIFINPEYEDYLNGLTGFLRRAWRDGDFSVSAGQFFTTFNEDIHVIEPFKIPSDWELVGSLDHGNAHPTAAYIMARSNDDNVYITSEHVANRTPISVHAKAINYMLDTLPGGPFKISHLRSFVAGGDVFAETRKGEGTVAQDYRKEGINLTAANTARIQGVQELQHDPKRPEDVLKIDADINGEGGDDPYDSIRMGLMEFAKPRGWIRGRG